jgi:hypothetical protein
MKYIAAYWGFKDSEHLRGTEEPSRIVCKVMEEDDPLAIEVCIEGISEGPPFQISDTVAPEKKRLVALMEVRKAILDYHKCNVDLYVAAGKISTSVHIFQDEFLILHR